MVSQRWAPRRCNGFRASEFPNQSDHCAQRSTPCTIQSVSLSFQCIAHPSKAVQIVLFVDRCDRHQHSRTWISRQWFFRAYASSCFSVRAPRLLAVPSNQTWRTLGVASYSRTNVSPLRSCGCDGGPACPAFRIFSSCDAPLTPPRFSPVPSAQLPAFQLEVRARCQPRSWPTFRPYA